MSSDSSPGAAPFGLNERTIINANWMVAVPWSFEKIFLHHYDLLRAARVAAETSGYLACAVFANEQLTAITPMLLPPEGPGARSLIIGRHQQAGLCIDQDPTVALRHLLVRLTRNATGRVLLRVLDLKTGQGFVVNGERGCESAASDGALFLRVGIYGLMFLPVGAAAWPEDPRALWPTLGAVQLLDERAAPPEPPLPLARPPRDDISQVTLLPGTSQLVAAPSPEAIPEDAMATLTLVRRDEEVIYPLRAGQLDRGVLLGRYSRCDVATRRMWTTDTISRVHLLLLREEGRVVAFDTASTNGLIINGIAVEEVELGRDALIELSPGNLVRWQRLREGGAGSGDIPINWDLN